MSTLVPGFQSFFVFFFASFCIGQISHQQLIPNCVFFSSDNLPSIHPSKNSFEILPGSLNPMYSKKINYLEKTHRRQISLFLRDLSLTHVLYACSCVSSTGRPDSLSEIHAPCPLQPSLNQPKN